MLYSLQNAHLSVQVDPLGAELRSLQDKAGVEYLWQRDPTLWARSAPLLFPWVGRLYHGRYQVNGRTYALPLHGFAKESMFFSEQDSPHMLKLHLRENGDTLAQFPFPFVLTVTYRLAGQTLHMDTLVHNPGPAPLYFGLGFHPGFRVPLTAGLDFSDYALQFAPGSRCPQRIQIAPNGLRTGRSIPFPLPGGNRLPLSHALFSQEAVVLAQAGHQVSLLPLPGGKGLSLSFPNAPYVALWQPANTAAPFLCIEPWCTLPGLDEKDTVWEQEPGMLRLLPGEHFLHKLDIRLLQVDP